MPVILDPACYGWWLEPAARDAPELMKGLKLLPEDALESYAVSPLVNRAGVEDPRCLEPYQPHSLW
jgi:putative SOS response-associated peptidase YedK